MIAVIPVRDGVQPLGSDEAISEAGGNALLVTGRFAPGAWATALAPRLTAERVVLPGAPDGRDLAPRLAYALGVPLLAGAIEVWETGARVARGASMVDIEVDGPFVATLIPGSRTAEPVSGEVETIELAAQGNDAEILEVLPPDPRTADLAEAPRILAAGAGLTRGDAPNGKDAVALLERVADALSASVGATRVVTDAGFAGYRRQIGTTGVVVDPELYIAFGISGAAQHIGGLGAPRHLVSVNTDASCPMTAMADLGIVTDATALLLELAEQLEASHG